MNSSNSGRPRPPPLDLTGLQPPSYGVNGPGGGSHADPTPPGAQAHGVPQRGAADFNALVTQGGTRTLQSSGTTSVEGTTPNGQFMIITRHRSGSVTESHHNSLDGDSGTHRAYHRDRNGDVTRSRQTAAVATQASHRALL